MTTHLSTGFEALDAVTGGLNGGELVLIGGRPGMGRTGFMLNIADQIARTGKTVLYFVSEPMKFYKGIIKKLVVVHKSREIILGLPDKWTLKRLSAKRIRLKNTDEPVENLPLHFFNKPSFSTASVRAAITAFPSAAGAVFIDGSEILKGEKRSLMLQRLKGIAEEFDVPVVVFSPLIRAIEFRKNKRPRLSDVKGFKDLSAVDKVLFLYREHYYLECDRPVLRRSETGDAYCARMIEWDKRLLCTEKMCDVIVAKTPSGEGGTVGLRFDALTGFFGE